MRHAPAVWSLRCERVTDTGELLYVPRTTDPQAWCRGYLAGFAADMTSWTPLLAALPELLKVIVSGAEGQRRAADGSLADTARLIHTF